MSLRVPAYAALCLCAAALQGCSNLKRDIGLEPTMPDEFAVESRAPLTLPPDYSLRPPRPGAPRPQEKTAAQQARNAFEQAGPGQPGSTATGSLNDLGAPPGGGADPNAQVVPGSLAGKLLGYDGQGDVAVTKRTTSPLKDVY
jgi:Protein of unknown function (DUF3035)